MKNRQGNWPGVNQLSAPLVDQLVADASDLEILVSRSANGSRIIDAGLKSLGSVEAGCRIAEICMADLGHVTIVPSDIAGMNFQIVHVETEHPVLSCLGSQYAGWSLKYDAEKKFRALGSGPARALAVKEPLFDELGYRDDSDRACLIVETSILPPIGLLDKVSHDCNVSPDSLTVILTPTGSIAGVTQIAARVVEVALHKAHEMKFDLDSILSAEGSTPLPPPTDDDLLAMGRTNDTILFAGSVSIRVDCGDDAARQLAETLPSCNSRDYGKPFAQVFKDYNYDFFEIDPMLFSPAQVTVHEVSTGHTFTGGALDYGLLCKSFFG